MISVELGRSFKSFLQEIFCGGGLLVVVCSIANRIFVAYTCANIKVKFVIFHISFVFCFLVVIFVAVGV